MDYFHYKGDQLLAEDVIIASIAEKFGTPCFVYSKAALENSYKAYKQAFDGHPHLICFAVKANSNLAVLNVLANLGAGFDIVSGGELSRVLAAGGNPNKVIFSGLGKTTSEICEGLDAGIHCFNVESEPELERINEIALSKRKIAPVSIRVNPDVDAETHPYISTGLKENKFGVSVEPALELYKIAMTMEGISITGIDFHVGSQLTHVEPFLNALERVLQMNAQLSKEGITIKHIDIGGGLGVTYEHEDPPTPHELVSLIKRKFNDLDLTIIIEPGRSIAANAGILVCRVEYLKSHEGKNFAIVDAAMNDLIRPALYDAWQKIIPVARTPKNNPLPYEVVGPICESADFLGKNRVLDIKPGDLLAVQSAGAYGFVMSSNYNSRPRAPELMVSGNQVHLIRDRETVTDLFRNEHILPA